MKRTLEEIDKLIDEWHKLDYICRLSHYLGMSDEEYQVFITNPKEWEKIYGSTLP